MKRACTSGVMLDRGAACCCVCSFINKKKMLQRDLRSTAGGLQIMQEKMHRARVLADPIEPALLTRPGLLSRARVCVSVITAAGAPVWAPQRGRSILTGPGRAAAVCARRESSNQSCSIVSAVRSARSTSRLNWTRVAFSPKAVLGDVIPVLHHQAELASFV